MSEVVTKEEIQRYIDSLKKHLDNICSQAGVNDYAVLYYEGKIDALKSLLKNGEKMCELDEGFGL